MQIRFSPRPLAPRSKPRIKSFRRKVISSAAALFAALSPPALASNPAYERVALIVGNSDYTSLPDLPNAVRDAAAMAEMLERNGYLVFEETDLSKEAFGKTIAEISTNLNADSEVVFFFAGHGFQIGSENYLVPTNSEISDLSDVPLQSISLTHVLEHLATQSGSQVVLLDSCRENPFAGTQAFNSLGSETLRIENGFSFQSAPVNSLLSFSTAPGSVALDGAGTNSPYTASLIDVTTRNPSQDIANLLPKVRAQVFSETDGFQVPWESSSLLRPVYLSRPQETDEDAIRPVPVAARSDSRVEGLVDIKVQGTLSKHFLLPSQDIVSGADPITVAALPNRGWLGVRDDTVLRPVRVGDVLTADEAERLTYSPDLRAARASRGPALVADQLRLERGGGALELNISLTMHDCDRFAASPLDPQGLGLSVENFQMVPDKALRACTQAVAEHPGESRFHYQLYRAQLAKRQMDAARISVNKALELGHVRAHLGLGQLKKAEAHGIGGGADTPVTQAVLHHYFEGHKRGDPMATYMLGRQLIRHGETAEERQRGYALLHRSKDAGYVEALNELARYFFLSKAGDANPERGLRYFEESAKRGNNQGFNGLGFVYKNGLGGIAPDLHEALANFEAASDLGHTTAPSSLGRIWAEGILTKPDFTKAYEWYLTGLNRGDPWGGTNAANLVLHGKVPGAVNMQAAVLAGKAVAIAKGSAREAAMDTLGRLSKRDRVRGLQSLLVQMGAGISVDGAAGRQTAEAIVETYGALLPLDTSSEVSQALVKVAQRYWQTADVRVDLH